MKASDSGPLASDKLRGVQAAAQATLKSVESRLERVMMSAHEDEVRARDEMQRLLRAHQDVSPIVEILSNDTKRRLHFGPLKNAFLTGKYKTELPGPLAELPEALRDRRDALIRAADVAKAYRQALESEEHEFFEERARARQQGREEPTREQPLERQRKR